MSFAVVLAFFSPQYLLLSFLYVLFLYAAEFIASLTGGERATIDMKRQGMIKQFLYSLYSHIMYDTE